MISSLTGRLKASSRDDADPAPQTSPQPPVGYLTHGPDALTGVPGIAYDYITAGNGLHAQAGNDLMVLRLPIAHAEVRGLADVDRKVHLKHGPIPAQLFELGLRWMETTPCTETLFAVRWTGTDYTLEMPEQQGSGASLRYQPPSGPGIIAEFHSHGRLPAFFSGTDDRDEQGFRFYGVAGRLDSNTPELVLRAGIYGNFGHVDWNELFQGQCPATIKDQEDSCQPEDPHL